MELIMPGQCNINQENPFNKEDPPEKMESIIPPHLNESSVNYHKGMKKLFANKLKKELEKYD